MIIKAPQPLNFDRRVPSLFLAGSIEMGRAEPWQPEVEQALAGEGFVLLNPRRDDWDSTWQQSIADANFREQVEWELEAQELATLIILYFAPASLAPISLLEFGLFARSNKLVVCCPDGFWRKGNVEVVCERYGVPRVETLADLIAEARRRLLRV